MKIYVAILGFLSLYALSSQVKSAKQISFTFKLYQKNGKYDGKVLRKNRRYFSKKAETYIECMLVCLQYPYCQSIFYSLDRQRCIGYTLPIINSDKLENSKGDFTFSTMFTACDHEGFIYNKRYRTCYKVISKKKTWSQAKDHCKRLGGRLAVLLPDRKIKAALALATEVEGAATWIGANDRQKEGTWRFTDGTKIPKYWKYLGRLNNFDGAYPGKQADCGVLGFQNKIIFDIYCGDLKQFLCERRDLE